MCLIVPLTMERCDTHRPSVLLLRYLTIIALVDVKLLPDLTILKRFQISIEIGNNFPQIVRATIFYSLFR